jgi:hypothetical protein
MNARHTCNCTPMQKYTLYAFWKLVGAQAIQDIVQRIEQAYKLLLALYTVT